MAKSMFGCNGARRWAAWRTSSVTAISRVPPDIARSSPRRARARGIAVRVQTMAEARVAAVQPDRVGERDRRTARPGGFVEQLAGEVAGSAVQRTGHRAETGTDHRVRVGSHRGGDAGGERRGGQLVVDGEDEGGVEAREQLGPRADRAPGEPRAARRSWTSGPPARRRGS